MNREGGVDELMFVHARSVGGNALPTLSCVRPSTLLEFGHLELFYRLLRWLTVRSMVTFPDNYGGKVAALH